MAEAKVPVREAVKAALDFMKVAVPRIAGVLAVVTLLSLLAWCSSGLLSLLFRALTALSSIMASGALLRLALADEHPGDLAFRPGPQGFQWSRTELNLLGAASLVMLLLSIGVLLLIMVATIGSAAAVFASGAGALHATRPPPAASAIVAVTALILMLVALWAVVRVIVYPAATVAQGRVQVFSTWPLTRGQFWPILAALFIVVLPALALSVVVVYVPMKPPAATATLIALALVNGFVELPLMNGLYAHLYKGLRPSAASAASGAAKGPWS